MRFFLKINLSQLMKKFISTVSKKLEELNQLRSNVKKQQKKTTSTEKKTETPQKSNLMHNVEISISTSSIVKIIAIIGLFIAFKNIIVELQSIVIISTIAFFLAIGLSPIVDKLESYKLPRPLAILVLYFVFFGIIGVLFVKIIPILAEQLFSIAQDLKHFIENGAQQKQIPLIDKLFEFTKLDTVEMQKVVSQNLADISKNLQSIAGSTFGVLNGIFQGLFNLIFALVLMFFILMEKEQIGNFTLLLFPHKNRKYIQSKFQSIQKKMAEWFKGQAILMVSMGLFMYAGMKFLEYTFGMKYAATIGLLAGVMELFPFLGVFITGVLSVLIAINISIYLVIAVLIWVGIAQFLEGNFLVPLVMEKVVGLSSVVTIMAISIGGILGSAIGGVPLAILGMIFAIPVAASIAIFVEEYTKRKDPLSK